MKSTKNIFLKPLLAAAFMLLNGNLFAAETPAIPWRNLKVASETSTFYFLTGLAVFLLIMIVVLSGVLKSLVSNKELWLKKGSGSKSTAVLIFAFIALSGTSAFAQADAAPTAQPIIVMTENIFWVLVTVNAILLFILFALLLLIRNMLKTLKGEDAVETSEAKQDIWAGALNAAVPVEREGEIMMNHEYDGIRELDNNLPPWWVWGFYFTIAFAGVYLTYYHITGQGDLPLEQYAKEMEEGQKMKEEYLAKSAAAVDEKSVTALTEAAVLEKGKNTFKTYCAACHGQLGEGGVGPNFADEYWIHGGGIQNIFKTIKYGVPAKGMIAWEAQLTPVQIQEAASYILTLKGTNPPNAKEPQGEKWVESVPVAQPDSAAADSAIAPVPANQ